MAPLRLEQYETVYYNENLNPMGVPGSVKRSLLASIDSVNRYPGDYYAPLKKAIADYTKSNEDYVVLGNGSLDLIRLFVALISPSKAIIPVPSSKEYTNALSIYGCEVEEYALDEASEYRLDMKDFISKLDSSYDMIIIGNPNNPTSQIISLDDMETLVEVCKQLDIFLLVDEMYIEFTEDYEKLSSVSLANEYDNIAIIRSVSKFFCVPGLRLGYAIMNNPENMAIISMTSTPNSISVLTAAACIDMFSDQGYIDQSRSMIYTERNLIYSAMSTNKNIKLYKPYGNFMLAKILKEDVSASKVAAHCNLKGLIIRNCEDIPGLDDKYIRFCFMNPKQNDLLVNTILDLL